MRQLPESMEPAVEEPNRSACCLWCFAAYPEYDVVARDLSRVTSNSLAVECYDSIRLCIDFSP